MKKINYPRHIAIILIALSLGGISVFAQSSISFMRFEAETATLTGGASIAADSGASGGNFISFFEQSPPGPVGQCGLVGEVFCENFEGGISTNGLRSGDLDSKKISFARMGGTPYQTVQNDTNWVRRASIPACRNGSVNNPFPPQDILICNPSTSINSHYGLVATAVQNYGDNWGRISQQFDISNRTGKIAFDASLYTGNALYGAAEIAFIDEPAAAPSIIDENSNGASPRNGLIISFADRCNGQTASSARPRVRNYQNYDEIRLTDAEGQDSFCSAEKAVLTKAERLNRVEVRFSQTHLEIWASDYSETGTSFGTLKKTFSANMNLNFGRGWVLIGSHNHATDKYGQFPSFNVLWDNIAFDGPAISPVKVYQASDSTRLSGSGMNLGYGFNNMNDTLMQPISIPNVSTAGVTSARLSYNFYFEHFFNPGFGSWRINYRLNGGTWHQYAMPATLATKYEARGANRFFFVTDINPSELVNGSNTIQFAGQGWNNGYTPFVANVDLITN